MADLSEYTFFEGVDLREDVKTLMQIFGDSWEECRAEDCSKCKYRHGKEQYALLACISERYVENIIAADVAPVRHGRWFFEPDGGTRCSECNKRVRDVTGGLNAPVDLSELPYCPKCSAKMDGGGD